MELEDYLTTGPYAGLSMISKNLGTSSIDDDEETLSKLSGLVHLARSIPVKCALDVDVPEYQAFKLALKSFIEDREQGRD